jgi:predicted methyltransferase
MPRLATLAYTVALVLAATAGRAASPDIEPTLAAALSGSQRSAKFVARDPVRHPAQELAFFGLRPGLSVVEIWPGGGYWTEILAPVLRDGGHFEVALPPPRDASAALSATPIGRKLAADHAVYDRVVLGVAGKDHPDIAPPDSADLVLSFRNLHNWMAGGYAPDMFAAFFKVLKHGGILGIEEHRGHRVGSQDPRAADGYVNQDAVIAFAKAAGFVLAGSSEMNANPRDTANWPRGVWTLPPDLALGDKDRAKYLAIGEADNAVLKFKKP